MITINTWIAAIMAVLPTAVIGFCFWLLERRITKRDAEHTKKRMAREAEEDRKEDAREQLQLLLIQSINASIDLSEATARAVQRIPDAKCNGDMHKALDDVGKFRGKQQDFLTKQGLKNIIE